MKELMHQRFKELDEIASRVRALILAAVHHAGAGHVGGPLSCTDMLVEKALLSWSNWQQF